MLRREILVAMAAASAVSKMQGATVTASVSERPALAIGDTWTYRVTDGTTGLEINEHRDTIVDIAGDAIWVERTVLHTPNSDRPGKPTRWATDSSWAGVNPARIGDYFLFKFPMAVGKTWDSEFTVKYKDGRESHRHNWAEVESLEAVTVPAGTFDALKVVHTERLVENFSDGVLNRRVKDIYWYDPKVMRHVRREYEVRGWKLELQDSFRGEMTSFQLAPR